ncbi:hypothetical protein HJG60_007933 [Phyllostomus discolor]|uniref:Uncharacterized protein n=1 Tax=Phyllostomus discolor TaxID=89673 RepID=A0A834EVP6_9CHIR|nr:hypothetical protein HJG60_007933 [Phyllostomus discolor]
MCWCLEPPSRRQRSRGLSPLHLTGGAVPRSCVRRARNPTQVPSLPKSGPWSGPGTVTQEGRRFWGPLDETVSSGEMGWKERSDAAWQMCYWLGLGAVQRAQVCVRSWAFAGESERLRVSVFLVHACGRSRSLRAARLSWLAAFEAVPTHAESSRCRMFRQKKSYLPI